MKLHNQCCTFEQAVKLKELGVIQDSLFYHTNSQKWGIMPKTSVDFTGNPYSAFNVAELVQMNNNNCSNIDYDKAHDNIYSQTSVDKENWSKQFTHYKTFAEACADKLIRAIEKEWTTVEEVNKRLLSDDTIESQ